jgi:hypothetical protein
LRMNVLCRQVLFYMILFIKMIKKECFDEQEQG